MADTKRVFELIDATRRSLDELEMELGGGGSADNRAASRLTNHAAIAQASPKTSSAATTITTPNPCRARRPHRPQ